MSDNNQDDDLEGADIWGDSNSSSDVPSNDNNDGDTNNNNNNNNDQTAASTSAPAAASGSAPNAAEEEKQQDDDSPEPDEVDDETAAMSTSELRQRIHLLDNDIRVMKSDLQRINHESRGQREKIRENVEKVKLNKQLPYLVGNVVEVLEPEAEDGEGINVLLYRFYSTLLIHTILYYK